MSKPGYVYVIAAPRGDRCKVGMTLGPPERRLRQLQTGNAAPLSLHGVARVANPRALEKRLHDRLAKARIRRTEWFAVSPSVAARLLRRLARPPRRVWRTIAAALLNLGLIGLVAYLLLGA